MVAQAPAGGGSAPNYISAALAESSHPTVLAVHFAARAAGVVVYVLFPWLVTSSFVVLATLVMVAVAVDFWLVKNVSGRFLVGLRWWSGLGADGASTVWTFEARGAAYQANGADARLFWGSLYASVVVWALLAVVALVRWHLAWLLVDCYAVAMCFTNLTGYLRCDRERRTRSSALGGSHASRPPSAASMESGASMANVQTSLITSYISNKLSSFIS